jgi:hypothetical protein
MRCNRSLDCATELYRLADTVLEAREEKLLKLTGFSALGRNPACMKLALKIFRGLREEA